MIRIDEIYNNTFWPWLKEHYPGVRMFFCDPFGRSDPDSIFNYGNDKIHEYNYILFFDQEPINLEIHIPTFDTVYGSNHDIFCIKDCTLNGYIVTSEKNSEIVNYICKRYRWKSLYYFFHGFAALLVPWILCVELRSARYQRISL